MKRLGIIGVGSAGILSLCHFIPSLDKNWQVVSIYDPESPILGIGESTNPTFVEVMQTAFAFNMLEDISELDGTHKFGTKWINWRKHSFMTPLLGGSLAIHFNTNKLKDFCFPRLKQFWGDKFQTLEGRVESTTNNNNRVEVVIGDTTHEFDYIIDCRGFPKELGENYHIMDYMPTNHALIHSKEGGQNWGYTGHRATKNGWMFEIPLTTRHTYGYLYNDKITALPQARLDFANELGISLKDLQTTEYTYTPFYTKKLVDKRIMYNGNQAIFIDPLSATSIFVYDKINHMLEKYMKTPGSIAIAEKSTNEDFVIKISEGIELLISYFYHGGSNYKTAFWNMAVDNCTAVVRRSPQMSRAIKNFNYWNEQGNPTSAMPQFYFPSNLSLELDGPRGFAYNYFAKK